ncbi:ubiquitin carboxyl-terminal hydrolase isozyme L3 [Trichonephila inaurata madagascariensis]|uniref:Ubiquitin carboxyl-terminal hydrolase n=1 Tax=Trichonephila inaurata madagascariensis TaxID=2747483 RepID=A0A8X6X8Q7_9ARAC|nr:ubiquitin carboxyl-terminal hydrolase isozyme L3 [Trichonephila inaurata madagascariensis]
MSAIKWLPLESNPDVMNNFLEHLGVPSVYGISDIVSLDDELLQLVPSPVLAVLLLFPVSEKYMDYCKNQEEIANSGDQVVDPKVYFMYQTIKNACGTVALIHAVANCADQLDLKPDSIIKKFFDDTKSLSPKERGEFLENCNEISSAHESSAEQGQTEAPNLDDKCNLHFIALVQINSKLYELDGRKSFPVFHGTTSPDSFLKDAARVCKEYMQRDPENLNFTALSFGAV